MTSIPQFSSYELIEGIYSNEAFSGLYRPEFVSSVYKDTTVETSIYRWFETHWNILDCMRCSWICKKHKNSPRWNYMNPTFLIATA